MPISTRPARCDHRHFLWQGRSLCGGIAPPGRPKGRGRVDGQAHRAREQDDGRRSHASEDALRRDPVTKAARDRAAIHRIRQDGRGDARRRRRAHRHRHGQGLLHSTDHLRRRHSRAMRISREEISAPSSPPSNSRTPTRPLSKPTTRSTAWPRAVWTRYIKKAHCIARSSKRERSGSTPTTSTIRRCRSAASSNRLRPRDQRGRPGTLHADQVGWLDLNL